MKNSFLFAVLLAAAVVSGCSSLKKNSKPAAAPSSTIVTPDMSLEAKVISVNVIGRFVVLDFPSGQLPKLDQTLFIYRAGLKVAAVKITGPQHEDNIVADLISGEARIGDIVRDE